MYYLYTKLHSLEKKNIREYFHAIIKKKVDDPCS